MIRITLNNDGEVMITQYAPPPAVYLDHWALRTISEDEGLAARLVTALETRQGTLALSWVNLVEFAKVESQEQAHRADNLIENILPRLFLLQVNPATVINREDALLAGGAEVAPHADLKFLRGLALLNRDSVAPLSARGLFGILRNERQRLVRRVEALGDTFIAQIEKLRREVEHDSALQAAVRTVPKGPQIQRGTRYIHRELVRPLAADRRKKVTRQDALDFFHAVVPVAYCDAVLLDKHWATQVEHIRSRFAAAGLNVPIASVFTKGREGIERLLRELETV